MDFFATNFSRGIADFVDQNGCPIVERPILEGYRHGLHRLIERVVYPEQSLTCDHGKFTVVVLVRLELTPS